MKHTAKFAKKLLTLLLAALLAFGVSAPAMALNKEDIKITMTGPKQPLPFGSEFTLSVKVEEPLPEGVEIASYQWFYRGNDIMSGETESTLHRAPGELHYPRASYPYESGDTWYSCRVTFSEQDADGNMVHTTISGNSFSVKVAPERAKKTFREAIDSATRFAPKFLAGLTMMSGGLGILFAPIILVVGFILGLFA